MTYIVVWSSISQCGVYSKLITRNLTPASTEWRVENDRLITLPDADYVDRGYWVTTLVAATENARPENVIFLPNIIKIDPYNFELFSCTFQSWVIIFEIQYDFNRK